eukprot:187074-Chlamydomonas_euryale.AAC.3
MQDVVRAASYPCAHILVSTASSLTTTRLSRVHTLVSTPMSHTLVLTSSPLHRYRPPMSPYPCSCPASLPLVPTPSPSSPLPRLHAFIRYASTPKQRLRRADPHRSFHLPTCFPSHLSAAPLPARPLLPPAPPPWAHLSARASNDDADQVLLLLHAEMLAEQRPQLALLAAHRVRMCGDGGAWVWG